MSCLSDQTPKFWVSKCAITTATQQATYATSKFVPSSTRNDVGDHVIPDPSVLWGTDKLFGLYARPCNDFLILMLRRVEIVCATIIIRSYFYLSNKCTRYLDISVLASPLSLLPSTFHACSPDFRDHAIIIIIMFVWVYLFAEMLSMCSLRMLL